VPGLLADHSGTAPQEIAEVRPGPEAFTAEMPGDLPLEDHRAKGELFARRGQPVRWLGAESVAP
jgi:hypothetical protein